MPLFYQHNINDECKLGIWHITEPESFFLEKVPLKQAITHWHKRLQHLAGRYLLQSLFPSFPYHLIEIADTRKPFLINEAYHFSISHCGDFAAAIVSTDKRVGIDIEIPTPKVQKIQHKFLSPTEMQFVNLANIPSDNSMPTDVKILTLLWSAKEAVFKWAGDGGIDFIKDIPLVPSVINFPVGSVHSNFIKGGSFDLELNYQFFDQLILVWLTTGLK